MPRIFGMDLTFHPSNEYEPSHNHNHNDRHLSRHRSHRNHSHSTTSSPAPQPNHKHISNRNNRHRPSDRSHTTHSSSTTPSPLLRSHPQDLSISDSDSDSNSKHDHAPETALAPHDPRKPHPHPEAQPPTPPKPNIRHGTFHAPNPYGEGDLKGEWIHIQSRNPATHPRRRYTNADIKSNTGRRQASGENKNDNTPSRPQERRFKSQTHTPSRRQNIPHDNSRLPHRTTSTNISNPTQSFMESAISTEHIFTTTDPDPGQQQRKRSGEVAVSFWKRDSGGIEGGGVRGVW